MASVRGRPSDDKDEGNMTEEQVEETGDIPVPEEVKQNRMPIQKRHVTLFGATEGCNGCRTIVRNARVQQSHNDECRHRMITAMKADVNEKAYAERMENRRGDAPAVEETANEQINVEVVNDGRARSSGIEPDERERQMTEQRNMERDESSTSR